MMVLACVLAAPLAADTPQLKEMRREIAQIEGQVEVLYATLQKNQSAAYQLENLRAEIERTKAQIARLKGRLNGSVPASSASEQCSSNLRAIGTLAELWSMKNSSRYPSSLSMLPANELKYYATCPEGKAYKYSREGESYLVRCPGSHGLTYSGLSGLGSR